jgi:hypothetical protein
MLKLLGRIDQGGRNRDDWHREFKIKWLIETDDILDGPQRAMNCPGLPAVGSPWRFGNDDDPWAICWPNWTVSQFNSSNHEPNTLWVVEQPYSTKFSMSGIQPVENPLAAPPDISGTFVKLQEEQRYDIFGQPILSLSFEPIRGKMAEFDANRPTVSIGMNYPTLGLNTFAFMIDNVNDSPMWGLFARMVKLSNVRWTRNVWRFGYFYTLNFDFDINYKTFDRIIPETGFLQLKPGGDKTIRKHWVTRKTEEGDTHPKEFYYTSTGADWNPNTDPGGTTIAKRMVKYYPQTNLFVLGIPASF